MRRLEWIGMKGVFSNPVVEYKLAIGAYSASDLRILREAARRRIFRVDTNVIRELRRDSPAGLSRTYQFGPTFDSYDQLVSDSDAKIILADPRLRQEFLDITDLERLGPAGTFKHEAHVLGEGEIIPRIVRTELLDEAGVQTAATAGGR